MAIEPLVRIAKSEEAAEVGRLLDDFNTEFDEETPGAEFVGERVRDLISRDAGTFFLVGTPPVGVAALRFRDAIWSDRPDAYLEELYVAPAHRGKGLGRALLERVLEFARERGAGRIDLGTAVDDRQARALYESFGFSNYEKPGVPGTQMLVYELEL